MDVSMLIYVLVTSVGYIGWVLYLSLRSDIQNNAPFVMKILEAVKKDLPILEVSHPKTSEIDVYVGTRSDKSSCVFDIEDMHLLFTPDSSTNIQPDRIGKLKIYHAEYLSPELMSRRNAIALNRLRLVRDKFPKLRFLTDQDLHALLSRPATEWHQNCSVVLAASKDKKAPAEVIPQTAEEFVTLLSNARDFLSSPDAALYDADEIGVTYESVRVRQNIPAQAKSFWDKLRGKKETASEGSGDSSTGGEYVYENAYRVPCGLQFFSWGYAFDTNSAAATARHMEQYGLEIEARTKMNFKNANEEMLKKLMSYLMPIGIFVTLCGVGVYFGTMAMGLI